MVLICESCHLFSISNYFFNAVDILTKLLLVQAVKQLLGYKSFEDMELESYSPDSLAQIVLHNLDSSESYLFDEGYFKPSKRHGTLAFYL